MAEPLPSLSQTSGDVGHYTRAERTSYTTTHTRAPHTRRVLQPEERALRKEKSAAKKITYNDRINQIHDYLLDKAREFHEDDASHTVEYYLADMLSRGKLVTSTRDMNLWCAFLHIRLNELNQGK